MLGSQEGAKSLDYSIRFRFLKNELSLILLSAVSIKGSYDNILVTIMMSLLYG